VLLKEILMHLNENIMWPVLQQAINQLFAQSFLLMQVLNCIKAIWLIRNASKSVAYISQNNTVIITIIRLIIIPLNFFAKFVNKNL